jgi:hypothetical protein
LGLEEQLKEDGNADWPEGSHTADEELEMTIYRHLHAIGCQRRFV